jgi:ribosomal protein S27AE
MSDFLSSQPNKQSAQHRCARCNAVMVPAGKIQGLAYFGNTMFVCQPCGETVFVSSHDDK